MKSYNRIKESAERLVGSYDRYGDQKYFRNDAEALSIVLESAKMLHEVLGEQEIDNGIFPIYSDDDIDHFSFKNPKNFVMFFKELGTDSEVFISKEDLKAIGIEVEE